MPSLRCARRLEDDTVAFLYFGLVALMARKLRIAAICLLALAAVVALALWGAYRAVQRVRPFYQQALALDPQVLEDGSRELESRATALYNDTQKIGQWQALFTSDEINGWLAVQLVESHAGQLPENVRDPRVAIAPGVLTLGFRTEQGGIETVVSVDASVLVTESGAIAVRLMSVRAGMLPLPVMQVADEIAAACRGLSLPVRWTQQDGRPVAIVEIHEDTSDNGRRLLVDSIELGDGELYVAGRTEDGSAASPPLSGNPGVE
jgi:hypothetical protein